MHGQAVAGGKRGDLRGVLGTDDRPAHAVVRVLEADDACRREVRVAGGRPHGLSDRRDRQRPVGSGRHRVVDEAAHDGGAAGFVVVDVRLVADDDLAATRAVRQQARGLPIVPLGTKTAASLPTRAAARRSSSLTVGSSPKTSSPTSAAAIAARMAGVGRVTVFGPGIDDAHLVRSNDTASAQMQPVRGWRYAERTGYRRQTAGLSADGPQGPLSPRGGDRQVVAAANVRASRAWGQTGLQPVA